MAVGLKVNFIEDRRVLNSNYINEKKLKGYLKKLSLGLGKFFSTQKAKDLFLIQKNHQLAFDFSLVGDKKIAQLNQNFRNKNKITDVLSFSYFDDLRKSMKDSMQINMIRSMDELYLGEIFICSSVCQKQASSFEISFEEECIHLLTHGFIHLLGLDHERSLKEEEETKKLEDFMLKQIASV